jgi:hypothetical protein
VYERSRIYTRSLYIRVSDADLTHLDQARGDQSRSAYIRSLIAEQTPPEELVDTSTTRGSRPNRRTPDHPPRPNHLAVVAPTDRHLHRYVKGDLVRHDKGNPIHAYRCECGATKEDT